MCMDFNDLKIYSHQHRLWQDQGSRPLTTALALTILWSQLTALATQIGLAQVVTQPLDSNMVTGCGTGLQVSTWPLAETWASTQTLAMAGPWTQTQSSAESQARMLPWSQVAAQATQIGMASEAVWSSETNMAPGGSSDHRSQHGLQQ